MPELGRHYYTGTHWSAKNGPKEWQLAAQKTASAIFWREAAELEGDKADPKQLKEFRDFAVNSGNRPRLEAMQGVLEPRLEKQVEDLDRDPFLFNVQNGTLELGNKSDKLAVRLRRHARLDHLTRIAPIGYDPDAECPLFRAFLEQIMPDYGAVVQFQTFIDAGQRRGGEPSPDLAKLTGARALFASEAKAGVRLDDGIIKQLTGGDPAAVRKCQPGFFRPGADL